MIEQIHLADIATYPPGRQTMDLARINYIYGSNGAGKTTISKLIARPDLSPSCDLTWKNGTPLEALVYNRDFVEANFNQSSPLRGIFTLGEDSIATQEEITAERSAIQQLTGEIGQLERTLAGEDGRSGKVGQLAALDRDLSEQCWEQKQRHDAAFSMAFEGGRSSRESFKAKLLAQRASNESELVDIEELRRKASVLFQTAPTPESLIPSLDVARLLECETEPLLAKAVIGRADVDIAEMIGRLGASSWVGQGRALYAANNGICPFCQRPAPAELAQSLAAYFDETFDRDQSAIVTLAEQYREDAQQLRDSLAELVAQPGRFLDVLRVRSLAEVVESKIQLNQQRLMAKQKEPESRVELVSLSPEFTELVAIIEAANASVRAHNAMVENLSVERSELTNQVWRYLVDVELKVALGDYDSKRAGLAAAVTNIEKTIVERKKAQRAREERIHELERATTSIRPTIEAMNGLLATFGFGGFRFAEGDDAVSYRLERPDGTNAQDSLSEGERSFVTFLYFYHRLMGSYSPNGATSDRIVVFDDPVSSLDSEILFVVSTLIKQVCRDVREGRGLIKQVFVLTHNVYFHKEVTFEPRRRQGHHLKDETFWVIRKVDGQSVVTQHPENPVTSVYELLWAEVRAADSSGIVLQNAMRRVLENYFKLLGGLDPEQLAAEFDGPDKVACRALISWVHDGSHSSSEGLMVAPSDGSVPQFKRVFRDIFYKKGHGAHYEMMMLTSEDDSAPAENPP